MNIYFDWQGKPISAEAWAKLFEDERHVGRDKIGDVEVSTVYMGIDPLFGLYRHDRPLIFETMVFGGKLDQYSWRWATDIEARAGHLTVLNEVAKLLHSHDH